MGDLLDMMDKMKRRMKTRNHQAKINLIPLGVPLVHKQWPGLRLVPKRHLLPEDTDSK